MADIAYWLLNGVTEDINGTGIAADGSKHSFAIWSTDFGGGSVSLQASPDGGTTWITLIIGGAAATYSANTVGVIDYLGPGMLIRAILASSTSPDAVYTRLF